MIFQILKLILILVVLPVAVGGIFSRVDNDGLNLPFRWLSGQICLWAGFLFLCVPIILQQRENGFISVIRGYLFFIFAMLLISIGTETKRIAKAGTMKRERREEKERDGIAVLLWSLVLILLVIQVILAGALAYEEGDDAFYVAVSTITDSSNTMYKILPYTGGETGLDARHGLAPFPIWVALVARFSGLHSATVAQIVLPMFLIVMAYTVYYMIGRRLFIKSMRRLPLFLLFLEVLVLFGGQSLYTSENFLLVRTAQGKAVLAAIVIPFIFLQLFILLETLQQDKKVSVHYWVLLVLSFATGCLCSTQGALLTCVLLAAGGICIVIGYRSWRLLLPMAGSCILPAGMALLYMLLD